ncbi:MAG TPA: hypothetical protein VNT26_15700 [Candidatus Sulfotelmatobacter sp.]|nr:hypothetical protein [Candidatus Sulfotelmatobacter sp.]HWI59535.1 hypothetical protein [Bacillota bacterium]
MIHNILRQIANIEHYGIASLCLFSCIFSGVLVWAFIQKKSHLEHMARVPLDSDSEEPLNGKHSHE